MVAVIVDWTELVEYCPLRRRGHFSLLVIYSLATSLLVTGSLGTEFNLGSGCHVNVLSGGPYQ